MTYLYMDVDAVEQIARQLQAQADHLVGIIQAVDRSVETAKAAWDGQDANAFRDSWVGEHRTALVSLADAVRHLSAEAVRNATEQRQASGH